MTSTLPIGILGTGSYLPKDEVTNDDVGTRVGVDDAWIRRKTMITARRYAAPAEAASDLGERAATAALEAAGVSADRIDYLIVPTSTGDYPMPATACLVQSAIGARNAACFDVNAACSGFVYGLAVARSLLAQTPGAHALVVATDVWSRFVDPDDRGTAVLLGDGAGAAVLGPAPSGSGILDVELRSRGESYQMLVVPAGGSRRPAAPDTVADRAHTLRMRGRDVTDFVLDTAPGAIRDLLARSGVPGPAVAHFVPHQANGVLLGRLVELLPIPGARVHLTLDRYGNTGGASVAVTLDEAARSGAIDRGDVVLLAGFGGGMSLGACLVRW